MQIWHLNWVVLPVWNTLWIKKKKMNVRHLSNNCKILTTCWNNVLDMLAYSIPFYYGIIFCYILQFVDGHLVCFHLGALVNDADRNICVQVFVWTVFWFLLGVYGGAELLSAMVFAFLNVATRQFTITLVACIISFVPCWSNQITFPQEFPFCWVKGKYLNCPIRRVCLFQFQIVFFPSYVKKSFSSKVSAGLKIHFPFRTVSLSFLTCFQRWCSGESLGKGQWFPLSPWGLHWS